MRCICLSHETALEFWRLWSARNGIALHLFHCRKTIQTDDLPFRIFPSSAVLVDSSSAKRTVVEIIDGALEDGVPEELTELLGACRVVLSETHSSKRSKEPGLADSSSGAGKVLHVLGHRKPGVRTADGLTYHHSSATYPKGSFLKIARGVYVCAPELVFAQMASLLPFGALLSLGYELCSPNRLVAFCSHLRGFKGSAPAKTAARYVLAKSASPAETSLAIIATAPRNYGGFGMRGARLNEPIKLRREAERIAHGSSLVCDVLWPERGVALEYDSSQFHGSSSRLSRDSRRRSALAAQGLEIRSITASVFEFQETILHAFRAAGCDFKRLNGKQLDRHMRLRSELRKCV